MYGFLAKLLKYIIFGRFDNFLKKCNGVIHIGANEAQERQHYKSLAVKSVIWIEADPEIFLKTLENIKSFSNYKAYNHLITDQTGKNYLFNVSNNAGNSSSIYDLKKEGHLEIYPNVNYVKKISLISYTLPDLVKKERIPINDYSALVLDVQGSELLVLKGCKEMLKVFKYIKLETSEFELYDTGGHGLISEIAEYLKLYDFYEVKKVTIGKNKKNQKIFDVLYSQRKF
jgi:FkbM family methyltransferase